MEGMEDSRRQVILVVDDIEIILRTMKFALESSFDVRLAKSGELALSIINSEQIDLILLDIEMPGISGFDFMQRLKNNAGMKPPPVIFVTAYATPELLTRAKMVGAIGYLVKPFAPDVLLKKVNEALEVADIVQ